VEGGLIGAVAEDGNITLAHTAVVQKNTSQFGEIQFIVVRADAQLLYTPHIAFGRVITRPETISMLHLTITCRLSLGIFWKAYLKGCHSSYYWC
jgi:hypothetical protein